MPSAWQTPWKPLKLSGGLVIVQEVDSGEEFVFNENFSCPDQAWASTRSRRGVFFNSPFGACPDCTGLGVILRVDESLVVSIPTFAESGAGRFRGWNLRPGKNGITSILPPWPIISGFSMDTPWKDLPKRRGTSSSMVRRREDQGQICEQQRRILL